MTDVSNLLKAYCAERSNRSLPGRAGRVFYNLAKLSPHIVVDGYCGARWQGFHKVAIPGTFYGDYLIEEIGKLNLDDAALTALLGIYIRFGPDKGLAIMRMAKAKLLDNPARFARHN